MSKVNDIATTALAVTCLGGMLITTGIVGTGLFFGSVGLGTFRYVFVPKAKGLTTEIKYSARYIADFFRGQHIGD